MNNGRIEKIAKYCSNCGKVLFKYWVSKRIKTCLFLKLDVICNREECRSLDSSFNNIEIKIDLKDLDEFATPPKEEVVKTF